MENNNQRVLIFVTIATILILVIIFAGVTYAFFTANNPKGSTAEIISKTGRMVINYDDGTNIIQPVTGIVPSNAIIVNKTFTLTGSNTTVGMKNSDGLSMPYKVGVKYTSTFSDGMMHYYIKEVNRPANSNVTVNYVITPETGKTENDYKNQTVPGNDTYTGYTHGTFKNGSKYTEMVTGEFPALKTDQTIKFNLIIQFPDNGLNQDSEKGKTFNGKVVVNYEPPKATTFAEDSWSTIAKVVQSGQLDAYPVGSEKEVEIGGTSYTVRVANNTTPTKCNDSNFSETACGFVVEFVDIVEEKIMNDGKSLLNDNISNKDLSIDSLIYNEKNKDVEIKMLAPSIPSSVGGTNVGGWPATPLRIYLNSEFIKKLPSELQKVIKSTKVVSGYGSSDKNANREDGNWESEDKIYLLSGHEVYEDGTSDQVSIYDTAWNNTRQLDYYKNKGVTMNNYSDVIKKNFNGLKSYWWLRSASSNVNDYFLLVKSSGDFGSNISGSTYGISPSFRIG